MNGHQNINSEESPEHITKLWLASAEGILSFIHVTVVSVLV